MCNYFIEYQYIYFANLRKMDKGKIKTTTSEVKSLNQLNTYFSGSQNKKVVLSTYWQAFFF
jgi:hypothetical protein